MATRKNIHNLSHGLPGFMQEKVQKRGFLKKDSQVGMPIPRQFSFLGDLGNRGEWQFVIPRGSRKLKHIPRVSGSGNFRENFVSDLKSI